MSIEKRKGSPFYRIVLFNNKKRHRFQTSIRVDDPEGELKAKRLELEFKYLTEKKDLEKYVWTFLQEYLDMTLTRPGIHIDDAWEYFSKSFCTDKNPDTVKKKENKWKGFTKWLKENYPMIEYLDEIDYIMAKKYSETLLSTGISQHTHNLYVCKIKEVISRLMLPANIQKNPFDFVEYGSANHESYRIFTKSEIEALLDNADPDWQTAILLGLYAGLDYTSSKSLKWSDIKNNIISTKRIKTASRSNKKMHIPVHEKIRLNLDQRDKSTEYVLPDSFRIRSKKSAFNKLLKKCNITDNSNGKVGFHSLRHTFVTNLEGFDIDIGTRQKLTGHASADMNIIYSHAIEPLKKAIDKLT